MELYLTRYSGQKDDTMGLLHNQNISNFMGHILEDEYRNKKVYGETRIGGGRLEIKFRTFGGFHDRYQKYYDNKFGVGWHKGMLWLQDVPNFKYVLIHIGNDDDDTAGCLIVGDTATQNITRNGFVGGSRSAYERIYPIIRDALVSGERVFINIKDLVL